MKRTHDYRIAGLAISLIGGLLTPAALAREGFTLTSVVPDDVFIFTAVQHNPERAFVEEYWGEVIAALKETGVGEDAMALVGSLLGDSQRAEVDRLKEKAKRLLEGVDFSGLKRGEAAFAERISLPESGGSGVSARPPDIVWLIRGAEGTAAKNYEGLVAILREIVAEVNKAADTEVLKVNTAPRMGAKVATLMSPEVGPAMSLSVASHGEMIIITLGEPILEDVLNLVNGKGLKRALGESPRFKQAFEKLPPAEDMMSFFDMQMLLRSVHGLVDFVLAEVKSDIGDVRRDQPLSPEAKELASKAHIAYKSKDYKQALGYMQKAHELAADNSTVMYNLACFNALLGAKDDALTWLEKSVDAGFYSPSHIAEDTDLDSLRGDARYTAALAKAKELAAAQSSEKRDWIGVVDRLVKRLMDVPGLIDYVASVEHTEGYSTHSDCNTVLVADASDKPFYSVFGRRQPLTNFERYLPKETISFSVNAGVDLNALYGFIEDTIRQVGPKGQEILTKWEAVQEEVGFNVKKDLLAWIDSELIQMTVQQPMGTATVAMLKVANEETAREKLAAALNALSTGLQEAVQQNPMLAMLAIQSSPATHEKLPGFHSVTIGMQPQPAVLGVSGGYAIFGTSADAVALCLATAAGEHPNVKKNSQAMDEAVLPNGAFRSMSLTDMRTLGQEISEVVGAVGMMGGMAAMAIPDPQGQQMLSKVLQLLMKLGPVAQKIDFYKSSASCTTFDGRVWQTHGVTNYKSPAERVAKSGS
ncbi:MAG: tetratricopeptide repeat protein [Phycisphaerae bacterium]